MHQVLANSGKRIYGVKTFIVETEAEKNKIPLLSTTMPGSTVFVLSTSTKYVLSQKKKWVKISHEPSEEPGEDNTEEIIYEGGDIDIDNSVVETELDYDGGSV